MLSVKTHVARIKYKIVLLGDQGTGKTAIINRFINDTFHSAYDVHLWFIERLQLALIFWLKMFVMMINNIDCNFGILLGRKDLKVLYPAISKIPAAVLLSMMRLMSPHLKMQYSGWTYTMSIKTKGLCLFWWGTKSILKMRKPSVIQFQDR